MIPIEIDLSGLKAQFNLASNQIDEMTELCVNEVTTSIYVNWAALAKSGLNSSLPEYLQNLHRVDKGRFAKQIVLTGVVPNMIEQGANPFDIKAGFQKSSKAKFTVPVYNKKGNMVSPGGAWYLTIPFRIGTPGTLGQAGFSGEMPDDVYDVVRDYQPGSQLSESEIPSPYDEHQTRGAVMIPKSTQIMFDEYTHRNSIYAGLSKRTGVYAKTNQNTYGTFRRAGQNSDPLSWIHKGITAKHFAEEAVKTTDVSNITESIVTNYLEKAL